MITKQCSFCGTTCPHNRMKKEGDYRCTYCGYPPSTGLKKGFHESIMHRQRASAQGRS